MTTQVAQQKDVETSREKLIQAAEWLFADHGFNGVSVRDIASTAGVNSALVGYYFGGKEGLLAEVYQRHCAPLNMERGKLLSGFQLSGNPVTLEQVLEAFVRPSLLVTIDKEGRCSGFMRLRAILSAENSALLEKLVADNFDESSRIFVDAFCECLPELTRDEVLWRFHFMLGTINYTAAGPNRIKALSEGRCNPLNPEETTRHLIPFLASGFRAQ